MRSRVVVAGLVLTAACAARGPSPQVLADLANAESLFRNGCYACLKEAAALYRKHADPRAADVALLVAIRERELGIPVAELPPHPLREAAALVLGETSGLDPVQRAALMGGRPVTGPDHPTRRALDPQFGIDLLATYIALAIDCESSRLIERVDLPGLTKTYAGVPLMQFRLARCGRPAQAPELAALRHNDPRWADTLFWEARHELVGSPTTGIDFPKALGLFNEGRQAFPASLAMTMQWASVNMSAEEFAASLTGYDEVLAVYPDHRDALIGRATALSYLLRHPEAVAAASRVIDLGTYHIADALYWRAWNRYHLKEYEPAWEDVENAIKGLSNSRVYMLAGLIAYARQALPTAEQRFDRAYEIDSSNCDATWMSGLVSIDREQLAVAAPKFTRAMSCFVRSAAALREDRARVATQIAARGTPATPREERQLTRLQRDAENADERSAQSAFNAAQCLARTGQTSQALTHVDVAMAHPRMKEKAEALKAAIRKQ